jgi:hypothetical protein
LEGAGTSPAVPVRHLSTNELFSAEPWPHFKVESNLTDMSGIRPFSRHYRPTLFEQPKTTLFSSGKYDRISIAD